METTTAAGVAGKRNTWNTLYSLLDQTADKQKSQTAVGTQIDARNPTAPYTRPEQDYYCGQKLAKSRKLEKKKHRN